MCWCRINLGCCDCIHLPPKHKDIKVWTSRFCVWWPIAYGDPGPHSYWDSQCSNHRSFSSQVTCECQGPILHLDAKLVVRQACIVVDLSGGDSPCWVLTKHPFQDHTMSGGKTFASWCKKWMASGANASLSQVLSFLQTGIDQDLRPNTPGGQVAALAMILPPVQCRVISRHLMSYDNFFSASSFPEDYR